MTFFHLKKKIQKFQTFLTVFFLVWSARLIWIGLYGVDVPFWDQWDGEADSIYLPILRGNYNPLHLISQHNEHRIFFTRVLSIAIFLLNGYWSTVIVMQIQAMIPAAIAGFFAQTIVNRSYPACLGIAIYFAAPLGTENMLWGFQSQFYFMILFSVISLYYFSLGESNSKSILLAFVFSVFAFFNIASGALVAFVIFTVSCLKIIFGLSENKKKTALISASFLLLFISEIFFTKLPSGHEGLHASDYHSYLNSLLFYLRWPGVNKMGLGYLIHGFTFILFFILLVFKREKLKELRIQYLISLQIWIYAQILLLVYARGGGSEVSIANRYLDILFLGPLFSFFVFVNLVNRRKIVLFANLSFLILTAVFAHRIIRDGFFERAGLFLQREKMLSVLVTAKRMEVKEKGSSLPFLLAKTPVVELPYPDAVRLHTLLTDPLFDKMMPILLYRE
ncbi:hypothetical protein LPTSP3_g20860 [Leptospira kobayashii]|uniref:Glycosyltransferase RgtA/B/C/D-like domain-containing protein n=1 Tax=Leptospira kobayashii TaxID=1917830 RepID=A0ABM7USK3_9LEPT|nr:hypothetical protein [Leptospira kobayashii]BDA79156.1 hypothetical protein LPTSP3_g20860 [Leptospira kobayashii]